MNPSTSTSKTVLFSAGVLGSILATAIGIGGGALSWAHATQRDGAGFYSTSAKGFQTSSGALVATDIDLRADPGGTDRLPGFLDVTTRVKASSTNGKPVFVGIASRADVDSYLRGAAHDVLDDVDFSPFHADYRRVPGERRLAPPVDQRFWVASASGAGDQSATWDVEDGQWAVVVMNADASDGVSADVAVGARTGVLLWIGLGLLVVAGLVSVGSVVAFRAAATGLPRPPAPPAVSPELEAVR